MAEQKLRRFRFLIYLYERSRGSEVVTVPHEELAHEGELSDDGYRDTFRYPT
jgi:hypothetical protein